MESDLKIIRDILFNLTINDLKIIGQSAENAIIFCYHTRKRRIICFDQHAVDERVRYERILSTGNKKLKLEEVKSLACHGAIRFGDKLTHLQCRKLITSVLKCKSPYRCAHLRPSVCILNTLDGLYIEDILKLPSDTNTSTESGKIHQDVVME